VFQITLSFTGSPHPLLPHTHTPLLACRPVAYTSTAMLVFLLVSNLAPHRRGKPVWRAGTRPGVPRRTSLSQLVRGDYRPTATCPPSPPSHRSTARAPPPSRPAAVLRHPGWPPSSAIVGSFKFSKKVSFLRQLSMMLDNSTLLCVCARVCVWTTLL